MSDELYGFRIKFEDVEIEYHDDNTLRVNEEYKKALNWLKRELNQKLSALERAIIELRENMAELKRIQHDEQYKPDKSLQRT